MEKAPSGRHRRDADRQSTYGEVIAIPEFRALWSGQALSLLGDQFAQIALALLVYRETGSTRATASVYALTYLPAIVGGPFLAGLADRFARRRVMLGCDLIRALMVAIMVIPGLPFAVLGALVFLVVLLSAPFSAARAALMPEILEGDRYVIGSALQNTTGQAVQTFGFVGGGALIMTIGPERALAIDALTFALSALIIFLGVRHRPAPGQPGEARPSMWAMTRTGTAMVFGDPKLRTLVLFAWLCGFYVLPEGLAVPYATKLYDGTLAVELVSGLLMAAMPVGTVIGALAFSRLVTPSGRLRAMGWMAMLSCAPLIGCVFRPPLYVVLALWVLSGIGGAYQLAANAAFVQLVPAERRGQAFGLVQSGLMAAQGIAILIGGFAADRLGPEPVVAFSGVIGVTAAAVLAVLWTEIAGEGAESPAEATA